MLEITGTTARLNNVVPSVKDRQLSVDVTLSVEVADGPTVLRQLHAHALAGTCWDSQGESALDDFDVRGRHKIENCRAMLTRNECKVEIATSDISNLKLRPTSNRRLELTFKITARVVSRDIAYLCALWADGEAQLSVHERQMSLDDAA
jgi:hypothetical protein